MILLSILLSSLTVGRANTQDLILNEVLNQNSSETLCPIPDDIQPCICRVRLDAKSEEEVLLDCSEVETEDQLRQIFADDSKFPQKIIDEFKIHGNEKFVTLDTNFNGVSFKRFILNYLPNLRSIKNEFFASSSDTVELIRFYHLPKLDGFPFDQISIFSTLLELSLDHTNIANIPLLTSSSLQTFAFARAPVKEISSGTFQNVPNLTKALIHHLPIKNLKSFTFPLHGGILEFAITETDLETIEPQAFFARGAVPGHFYLDLSQNNLRAVEKDVFEPLMTYLVHLQLYRNPLSCGCEILWLISETGYLNKVTRLDGSARCANSIAVGDLHADILKNSCDLGITRSLSARNQEKKNKQKPNETSEDESVNEIDSQPFSRFKI